jgi:hypothetical protein
MHKSSSRSGRMARQLSASRNLSGALGLVHLLVVLGRVPFLIVGSNNREAEPFESEEKHKESRTDDPEHGWFIGTTFPEHDPIFRL